MSMLASQGYENLRRSLEAADMILRYAGIK